MAVKQVFLNLKIMSPCGRVVGCELFSRDYHQPNVVAHSVSTLLEHSFLEQLRPGCNAMCHLFRADI